jgi:hypothetical protein
MTIVIIRDKDLRIPKSIMQGFGFTAALETLGIAGYATISLARR